MNRTCNKIWEIEYHEIREFVGTYDEWEEMKRKRASQQGNTTPSLNTDTKKNVEQKSKASTEGRAGNANDKNLKREHQTLQKQFVQIEEKIATFTKEKDQLEQSLADKDVYSDHKKFGNVERSIKTLSAQLQDLNIKYESMFDSLMELEKKLAAE